MIATYASGSCRRPLVTHPILPVPMTKIDLSLGATNLGPPARTAARSEPAADTAASINARRVTFLLLPSFSFQRLRRNTPLESILTPSLLPPVTHAATVIRPPLAKSLNQPPLEARQVLTMATHLMGRRLTRVPVVVRGPDSPSRVLRDGEINRHAIEKRGAAVSGEGPFTSAARASVQAR